MNKTMTAIFKICCACVLLVFSLSTIPESAATPIILSYGKPVKIDVQANEAVAFYKQGWVDLQRGNLDKAQKVRLV